MTTVDIELAKGILAESGLERDEFAKLSLIAGGHPAGGQEGTCVLIPHQSGMLEIDWDNGAATRIGDKANRVIKRSFTSL